MELIDVQSRKINLNGKEIEIEIEIHTEPEFEAPDFDYGNAEENAKEIKRFESGEMENVCIRVQASFDGVVEADYLGQCFILSDKFKTQVLETVETYGMVEIALSDLEKRLKSLVEKIA